MHWLGVWGPNAHVLNRCALLLRCCAVAARALRWLLLPSVVAVCAVASLCGPIRPRTDFVCRSLRLYVPDDPLRR
jgi:hypothetical protein